VQEAHEAGRVAIHRGLEQSWRLFAGNCSASPRRSRARLAKAQSFDPVVYSAGKDIAGPDAIAEINDMRERYRLAVEPPAEDERGIFVTSC
jgi:hypothetical protein